MKRNWALIKQILEALEEKSIDDVLRPKEIEGYSEEEVSYHLLLLYEAGLIVAKCQGQRPGQKIFCRGLRITWEGYELLEAMRSKRLWNRLKERLSQAGIQVSLTAIKAVISEITKEIVT
ncbi:MAG: DUF2513 domain-containing protein [Candidatus Desulfofervidus auxilii]|nr:DUF2513 domain-containing protein [Candidatus Desulfofervidus auxilii]